MSGTRKERTAALCAIAIISLNSDSNSLFCLKARQTAIEADTIMALFDQPIGGDEQRIGCRLNVVSFTGNQSLVTTTLALADELDGSVYVEETTDKADVLLVEFPDIDQTQARTIACAVRECGFREAGTCYAAVRYDSGPGKNVDYLVAFE